MIKVAVLWIINEDGEILLAQRAHHKSQDPDVWGPSVTGKLEVGETFDQALVREVEEELGLKPTDYTPIYLFEKDFMHPDGELRKFGVYYTIFPKAKTDMIRADANEVAGVEWNPLKTIIEKMQAGTDEFPASAPAIWPDVFQALGDAKII